MYATLRMESDARGVVLSVPRGAVLATGNRQLVFVRLANGQLQPRTVSKLFCACAIEAGEPNTSLCPTCLGMPGAKPRLNRGAFEAALKLALAPGASPERPTPRNCGCGRNSRC